ncbi:MAG: hypothetical protein IPG45_00805 [Deltaproteobacteria bacterium]|nr:hypothetical protein [Deltaproteobacteria bacterium]
MPWPWAPCLGVMLAAAPTPTAVLVLAPLGQRAEAARVGEGLVAAIQAVSDLSAERVDVALADGCRGRVGCLVMRQNPRFRWVFIATYLPRADQPPLLRLVLVDAEEAQNVRANVDAQALDWLDRVEEDTWRRAIALPEQSYELHASKALHAQLVEAVRVALAAVPSGAKRLRSEPALKPAAAVDSAPPS